MNIQQLNPFITYLSRSSIFSSDIIIKTEKQNNIVFTLPKPIYFYNGPDHIRSCLYSEEQYNEKLLPYLTNRLKKHKMYNAYVKKQFPNAVVDANEYGGTKVTLK